MYLHNRPWLEVVGHERVDPAFWAVNDFAGVDLVHKLDRKQNQLGTRSYRKKGSPFAQLGT